MLVLDFLLGSNNIMWNGICPFNKQALNWALALNVFMEQTILEITTTTTYGHRIDHEWVFVKAFETSWIL